MRLIKAVKLSKAGIIFCVFVTLLNDRLGETLIIPLIPKLNTTFGLDPFLLGLIVGTYPLLQFAAAPLIGALSDKHGRKPIITICVSGSVIGLALFAITINYWNQNIESLYGGTYLILLMIFISRIIDGISGGTASSATAILADISTPENRAKAFGLIGVAFGLGFILGPFMGGILTNINLSLPALISSLFALFNLILVIIVLPETYKKDKNIIESKKKNINPLEQVINTLVNPLISKLSLAFFIFFTAFSGVTGFLLLYLEQIFGWVGNEKVTILNYFIVSKGLLPSISFAWVGVVAIVIQGFLIGRLVKNFGEQKLTQIGIACVIAGCFYLLSANSSNAIHLVFLSCTLLAIGTGLVVPSLRAIISKKLTSSGQGTVLGNLQALQSLGSCIGIYFAGFAYKQFGPSSPFIIGTVFLVIVGLLITQPTRRNYEI